MTLGQVFVSEGFFEKDFLKVYKCSPRLSNLSMDLPQRPAAPRTTAARTNDMSLCTGGMGGSQLRLSGSIKKELSQTHSVETMLSPIIMLLTSE